MTKIVKGGKVYPFITGDDVVITKGSKHPGKTVDDAIEEVDNTLDEHQKDIDKLKSNLKYVYSYGGVGGKGSGGSGGGSAGAAALFISLNGHQLQSGGNTIVLNEPGKYTVEGSVSNSNGEVFYVTVGVGNKIDYPDTFKLSTELNRCRFSTTVNLATNGEIVVWFYDSEYSPLASIRQNYIVNPHTYEMKFKYMFDSGGGNMQEGTFDSSNEYFIGDTAYKNPFIDMSYKIDIPNVTNISIKYTIGDTTDGSDTVSYGTTTDITGNHLKIYLDDLHRNGKQFTDESNTGTYTVTSVLSYTSNGELVETTKTFKITLIPNYLYINVRNPQDLLYDNLEDLLEAINNGVDGIPAKSLNVGTYIAFYCKIYEGTIKTAKQQYPLTFKAFDEIEDSESEYTFDEENPAIVENKTGVVEQVETPKPISVAFETTGIKKLEFSTVGQKTIVHTDEKPVVKYIYVKESQSDIDWYPGSLEHNNFYFRANSGTDTFSTNFPHDQFQGTSPFEIRDTDRPITLTDPSWANPTGGYDTTILSLGMQYSVVNSDGAEILRTYSSGESQIQVPDITMYSDRLFADNKKICIPTESNFNKTISDQYHLVQIVRYRIGLDGTGRPQYATYLYIDGKLESNNPTLSDNQLFVGKIVFNNVNVVYNLINIQYVKLDTPDVSDSLYSIDGLIYQYYLAYKSIMHAGTVSESEKVIFDNLSDMKFDGENVIVPESFIQTVSPYMPIPTMMMTYTGDDIEAFTRNLFKGYPNGDDAFGRRPITLHWCDGLKQGVRTDFNEVIIPTITDRETGFSYDGDWMVELQGTSTMRNKIKNFSLVVNTRNTTGDKYILMSPNYDANDEHSFLPERIWTLKADIADSAHANNTAVGKFVNHNCTPFSSTNGVNLPAEVSKYVKNTLEGFPVLMYFKVGETVYYLGVYNFNMGRNSYYNLGYHTAADMTDMIGNITSSGESSFSYSIGTGDVISTLAVGEVQDNYAQFDFHQYDDTVLFQPDDSSITRMFGKDSKITGANKAAAKGTLRNFVRSVAKAGTYCFANIGKTPISSKADDSTDCINRYDVYKYLDENNNKRYIEYVPDISWQFHYEGTEKRWEQKTDITFDSIKGDVDNLLQCIYSTDLADNPHDYFLEFSSVSEYYTICMAFGLVDSILKNMNIKSWDGTKCYVAFYDMDCALGENNAGGEDVSYLAATDYWHSDSDRGYVEPVTINYDYWDDNVGKGFDFSSSYLFAIAKYAQAIFDKLEDKSITLNNYPQQFWAKLRHPETGELRNTNYFINNYFSSGIGQIPTYLASLNYQVKYLYKGTILDDDGRETEVRFIANENAFNGTRLEKVKDWLNRRLHFLDVMFNVQGVGINIGGGYVIPKADTSILNDLSGNNDIVVLSDMFSTQNAKSALMSSNALPVNIYAPMNTPFIINRGSSNEIYLLCAGTDNPNPVKITATRSESYRFLGSKEFTNVSLVEPFLTTAYQINSNNIEEINYGGRDVPPYTATFTITSTSVKKVKLGIPTFTGTLVIKNNDLNGQAIHTLDVSTSGFVGNWEDLKNLKSLNISGVNNPTGTISVSECPLIGDECSISGIDDKPTTLNTLRLLGVSGNFVINNTSIQEIQIEAAKGKDATFEIFDNILLNTLKLSGFRSIIIRGCPNLKNLVIEDDTDNPVCEKIIIDIPEYIPEDGSTQQILGGFDNIYDGVTVPGVFDFTKFKNLQTLGISGCEGIVVIKIPNHKVSISTFKNNKNLEFVDTSGQNSVIELTTDSTFYNCPKYGMRQSWWSSDDSNTNGKNIKTDIYTTTKTNARVGNYTRMCISPLCETLAHTFDKVNSAIQSPYLKSGSNPYQNTWGQWVYNQLIDNKDAAYFINNFVAGKKVDNEYIDDNNIIHDTSGQGHTSFGPNCCANIYSLQGCFNKQSGIRYTGSPTATIPNLSEFTSLTNISLMYYGTEVKFLSAALLSLPQELNNTDDMHDESIPSHSLNWSDFIGSGNLKISKDAFKNISYRITDISMMTLSIYGTGSGYNTMVNTNESDGYLDIVDILCPKRDGEDNIIPFERLNSFTYFSVDGSQYVDYRNLFKVCPNVTHLVGFLNSDLSKSKIDGALKECKKLQVVDASFSHSGNIPEAPEIDLYDFFNWGDEEHPEESLFNMTNLFTATGNEIGFAVNKTISQEHFEEIMNLLHNYKNITKLSNLFSYCTITNYDSNYEIKLGHLEAGEVMNKITNVNSLFYHCKSGNGTPLKIRRSFFECLPNVTSVANTFGGVWFDHMLTYDFFCKRNNVTETSNIYVEVDTTKPVNSDARYAPATLHTIGYGTSLINNMNSCFMDAKFVNCKCWFDINDGNLGLKPVKDTVVDGNNQTYNSYFRKESGVYVKYDITEPVAYSDTLNNFTNYVPDVHSGDRFKINNHNIDSELGEFGNKQDGYPYTENDFNVYPTYCCLPPDIFHCCYNDCDLVNVFANTNIIGVIPQHLLTKCYNSKLSNMLVNVNILPNLIYHYNSKTINNDYLTLIASIPVDNVTITIPTGPDDLVTYTLTGSTDDDATVLFRTATGELRRRYPITTGEHKDYNKSQFVYVPQGYTTNRNLERAFNFRYNLPAQVDLYASVLIQDGINWGSTTAGTGNSPDLRPDLWPYYTQYFFTVDESVAWNRIYNISNPFIGGGDDLSFKANATGEYEHRVFSSGNLDYKNKWWDEYEAVTYSEWNTHTNGIFNVFLNLCGKRDVRTGKLTDYGCPISRAMSNDPVLSSFVSDTLVVFLNGKVFDDSMDAGRLLSRNGSSIIDFNTGFGRNIVLPNINYIMTSHPRIILSYSNNNILFYKFMFPSESYANYVEIYGGSSFDSKVDKTSPKYIIRE